MPGRRVNRRFHPVVIAITGGSGSGKSWLAERLQRLLRANAARLSLDDFYRDRSHLPYARRSKLNFDHPRAIDWRALHCALRACASGRNTRLPSYDFATHTRRQCARQWRPGRVVLVDGLWLLRPAAIRRLFHLRIYLDCPPSLRLRRRLERDVAERGRSPESVRRQFAETVAPMHERFVAPQVRWADFVLKQPFQSDDLDLLSVVLWSALPDGSGLSKGRFESFQSELATLLLRKTDQP